MPTHYSRLHRSNTPAKQQPQAPHQLTRYVPLTQSPAVQRLVANPDTDMDSGRLAPSDIAYLQSTIGNRSVQRLLLDPEHKRNEAQARGVQHRSAVSGEVAAGEVDADGGAVGPDMEDRIRRSQSGGSPMPRSMRDILQPKLQADLKNVRLHTDDNAVQLARDLNAQAFTFKNHIFYGAGKSPSDLALTTHEAVHTVQQGAVARRFDAAMPAKQNGIETGRIQAPAVQRLPTAAQLEASAGGAKQDWKLGKLTLRKMSTKYKAVLNALRAYDRILDQRVGGELSGYKLRSPWDLDASAGLENLERAVNAYLAAHNDDDRAGQIRAIKEEIPQEQAVIDHIGANMDRYANLTGREAIDKVAMGKKAAAAAAQDHFSQGKSMGQLLDVVSGNNEEANTSIEEQLSGARSGWENSGSGFGQAFRGSDILSKTSGEYAKGNFLPYYLNTVIPAFVEVVEAIRGSGIGELKGYNTDTGLEERSNDPAVYATISRVYLRFARTLMRALPTELVSGAAVVYARIRSQTKKDSEAFSKKLALSVATNMIYVRCFGPALNSMSGSLSNDLAPNEKQAITAIVQLLAKQGPGVRLDISPGNEYARLGLEDGVQEAGLEYERIMDRIVAQGERMIG